MSLAGRASLGGARWAPLSLVALLAHGCAPAVAPPTPGEPPHAASSAHPRPRPGYDRRIDDLSAVDTVNLRGRRIALDPGHGGFFRGALGVGGITEAEVNLGVALDLRGLLEARGAVVFMTRTDDRDFLTPADSALRTDLAARSDLANASRPDLFVSIHHNADARGAHDVNETQTYYKLGDDGPSLEAAQSVHRYLVRNLGIERHRLLPGNFYVLRTSDVPAILTEASYVTNPDVESKLALASKQRLEAEALLLGIAHYFARPRPTIDEFVALTPDGGPPDSVTPGRVPQDYFHAIPAPVFRARISGPHDDVELTVDGDPVPASGGDGSLEWRLAPLLEGRTHEARLRARLAGSGSAVDRRIGFVVSRPASRIALERIGPVIGAQGGLVSVRLRVEDALGLPHSEGGRVRVTADSRRVSPRDTVLAAAADLARLVLTVAPGSAPARVRARFDPPRTGVAEPSLEVAGTPRAGERGSRAGFVIGMPDGRPIESSPESQAPSPPGWLDAGGFGVVPLDSAGRPAPMRVRGYRAWASDEPWPLRVVAIAGGALHGKRVVVDPDGGGDDDAGTGASGTRAANLNLGVARVLANFLEAAGADVRLTREGDFAVSDVERVQISEAFRADRFVRIGHRPEDPMAGYYFSSAPGKRWAERTSHALEAFGLTAPRVAEDAQYVIQQTSCPGLFVSAARVDDPASEERLASPAAVRAEAYAIYIALLGEWNTTEFPIDSLTVLDGDTPASGAAVSLGGSLLLLTDAGGKVRFARTESGPLEVDVEHPRVRARRVLLDSTTGVTVTGSRGP